MVAKLGFDSGNDEESVIDGQWEDTSDIQDDIDGQLNSIFAEVGGDERDTEFALKVYRVVENKGKLEYCFSCVPSELPILDRLRDDYGGGQFEVRVYKDNRIFRRRKVAVAAPPKRPEPAPPQSPDMAAILKQMQESQQQQFEQMRQLMAGMQQQQPQPQPQPNMIEMMGSMMGVMAQMKDFMVPAKSSSEVDQFVKMLQTVKDLGLDGAERGPLDGIASIAKEFAGPLLGAVSSMSQMQGQSGSQPEQAAPHNPQQLQYRPAPSNGTESAPTQTPQNHTPQNPPQNPAQNPAPANGGASETNEENERMNMLFKQQLALLINQAAADRDPGLYAELILDQVPEAHIRALIDRPDMIEYLSGFDTRVKQFEAWFVELQSAIQEGLRPDPNWSDNQGDATKPDQNADAATQPESESTAQPQSSEPASGDT